jgi:hypothetical protein
VDDRHAGVDDADLDGERGRRGRRQSVRQLEEEVQRPGLRGLDERATSAAT